MQEYTPYTDVSAKLPVTVFAATYGLQGRGEYGRVIFCRDL